jgi:hypothetical protein
MQCCICSVDQLCNNRSATAIKEHQEQEIMQLYNTGKHSCTLTTCHYECTFLIMIVVFVFGIVFETGGVLQPITNLG